MANSTFVLREIEFQVEYPGTTYSGDPMTVFGLNTGIRVLDNVSLLVDSANSVNNSGLLYGSLAVVGADLDDGLPTASVCVYLNPERTVFSQLRLRLPDVAATTLTVPVTSENTVATFADAPVVTPYGLRVAITSNEASDGTGTVDIFLMGSEHGCSRG